MMVEVVLPHAGGAITVERYWAQLSVDMKPNTENFGSRDY
jgi:hypothetical protein